MKRRSHGTLSYAIEFHYYAKDMNDRNGKNVWMLAAAVAIVWMMGIGRCDAQSAPPDPTDTRTQYPPLLANSYFGLSVGSVSTPFTAEQLQPGFTSTQIDTPTAGASIALLGHQFNQYIGAEMAYARPFKWATFNNLNGTGQGRSVWMAIGEFKLRLRLPVTDRFAMYTDAGLAITSRHGATTDDGRPIVADANFLVPLVGAGAEITVNPRWSFVAGFTRTAGSDEDKQPATTVVTGGVRYHMRSLDAAQLREASQGGYLFPKRLIQVGYAYGGAGLGVNDFLSSDVPIFWGANLSVDHGFTLRYEQNLFHSRKLFAFDLGLSFARWHAVTTADHLVAASVYPIVKFIPIRTDAFDFQFQYSVAGPTM